MSCDLTVKYVKTGVTCVGMLNIPGENVFVLHCLHVETGSWE